MRGILTWLGGVIILSSCSVEPQPIDYGNDNCAFCRMTIVDTRYGAEIVTSKGKVFKFDAVECLINYSKQKNLHKGNTSYILVTDYSTPATLFDATQGQYVRSVKLPSPMGMFITGFAEAAEAKRLAKEHGGEVYSWQDLNQAFEQLPNLTDSSNSAGL